MQQVLNTLYLHFAIPCPLMVNLKITITTVPRNIASHLNIIPMKAGAGKKITDKKKTQENYILSLTNLQADTLTLANKHGSHAACYLLLMKNHHLRLSMYHII